MVAVGLASAGSSLVVVVMVVIIVVVSRRRGSNESRSGRNDRGGSSILGGFLSRVAGELLGSRGGGGFSDTRSTVPFPLSFLVINCVLGICLPVVAVRLTVATSSHGDSVLGHNSCSYSKEKGY